MFGIEKDIRRSDLYIDLEWSNLQRNGIFQDLDKPTKHQCFPGKGWAGVCWHGHARSLNLCNPLWNLTLMLSIHAARVLRDSFLPKIEK
mmetsp:Transcript_6275/g.11548  ORF Transcript_6275/g.11548 Transcript_6275/m.11548 type:complete len:89 (-) Transcript_6275:82-348(-)